MEGALYLYDLKFETQKVVELKYRDLFRDNRKGRGGAEGTSAEAVLGPPQRLKRFQAAS